MRIEAKVRRLELDPADAQRLDPVRGLGVDFAAEGDEARPFPEILRDPGEVRVGQLQGNLDLENGLHLLVERLAEDGNVGRRLRRDALGQDQAPAVGDRPALRDNGLGVVVLFDDLGAKPGMAQDLQIEQLGGDARAPHG